MKTTVHVRLDRLSSDPARWRLTFDDHWLVVGTPDLFNYGRLRYLARGKVQLPRVSDSEWTHVLRLAMDKARTRLDGSEKDCSGRGNKALVPRPMPAVA